MRTKKELREAIAAQIRQRNGYTRELRALQASETPNEARETQIRGWLAQIDDKLEADHLELAELLAREDDAPAAVPAPGPRTTAFDGEWRADGRPAAQDRAAADASTFTRTDGTSATVARGESVASHPVTRAYAEANQGRDAAIIGQYGGIGQMMRALTTGTASTVVPTDWSSQIIDRARNAARVLQAGAQIVPMSAKVETIGRLTTDPVAAFRTEGSTVTASDPAFDSVTLTATTMSCLVVGSMEWFQDAINADEVVTNAIGKAMGLNLDLVALYGGITSGAGTINLATPPNPRGVLAALNATLPANVLGAATNGTVQTTAKFYQELINTLYQVRRGNEEPTAMIYSPRLGAMYANAYDTVGQPVRLPDALNGFPRLETSQVPSYTQGTGTNMTDVFAGNWAELLIGQRLDMTLQRLDQRYAENGQVAFVCHWRGDVQPARPTAFAVYRALQGV